VHLTGAVAVCNFLPQIRQRHIGAEALNQILLTNASAFRARLRTTSAGYSWSEREPVIAFSDRSVGAIQFYFRLVAVHDRYYLMVCTARALKGAPVVIRLVSRFNRDKEHRDAASRASPRTKRSLFSSKAASLRHRYSPTNSKLVPGSEAVEAVSSHRSI
jgi:hypothetical protein